MGTRGLRRCQLGLEVTEGTPVAATAIYRSPAEMPEDRRVVTQVNEEVGYLPGTDRTYTPSIEGALTFPSHEATFEQAPYVMAASIKDVVTGATDGAGTDKIYAYPFPTTALNAIKTYTLEAGDDQQAQEMEGSWVESWELSGVGGAAWMLTALWRGRQWTNTTFTGALAIPAVDTLLFGKTKLYLDAIGGTIGTTLQTGTFLGASIRFTSGWEFKPSGEGNLYPTIRYFNASKYMLEVDVTFEHDTAGVARVTDYRAETARLVRIQCDGPAVGTPGTTYSTKAMRFDCAAKVASLGYDEQNGNDILKITMRSRYNTTAAIHATISLVNELASLT